jgi:hypothetical protein
MMFGRMVFALIMGFGVIISFLGKQMALALFFAIVCGITVLSMKYGKKPEVVR